MTIDEAIEILDRSIYYIEWDYPMEYATALDMAIDALKAWKDADEHPRKFK